MPEKKLSEKELIEKELTELLLNNLQKIRFPTGVEVVKETIRKYFENYKS